VRRVEDVWGDGEVQVFGGPSPPLLVHDMTDRETADERQSRMDQLAAIVEYSDDAIIGKTLDGIITSWNPAAERMYGYPREEIIGKSVNLLIPGDRLGEVADTLAKIVAGDRVEHHHTARLRKDGTVIPVSLTASPIRNADGRIIGVSTMARDLTRQEEAYELGRSLIEASLDPMVTISPEGKITDVNEATVKATGVPRNQLIGTAFSDYFTEPEKADKIYRLVFAEGMAVDYPLTVRHRDGGVTEVLYNASVYRDAAGKVLGVFAAARDVTKQVRAQREVAEQQAIELERMAELERFQRLTVGRELKMVELKREIENLRDIVQRDRRSHDDSR
jgi:PAS domain S-box-containing protein